MPAVIMLEIVLPDRICTIACTDESAHVRHRLRISYDIYVGRHIVALGPF